MKCKKANRWKNYIISIAALALYLISLNLVAQQDAGDLQRNLEDLEVGSDWIYDDLQQGIAQAKESGKPLFVLFR